MNHNDYYSRVLIIYLTTWFMGQNDFFITALSCSENLTAICGPKCSITSTGELDLDCSNAQLTSMIRQLQETNIAISRLEVHENQTFTELPERTFEKLTVRQLDLSGNQISQISSDAFVGQEATLTSLNLSSNNLSSLPNISSLKNLQVLDISNNGQLIGKLQASDFEQNINLRVVRLDIDKALLLTKFASTSNTVTSNGGGSGVVQQQAATSNVVASGSTSNFQQLHALAGPVNSLMGASLMSELLRNLPVLLGGFSANRIVYVNPLEPPPPQLLSSPSPPLSPQQPTALSGVDLSKISPDVLQKAAKANSADFSAFLPTLLDPNVPLPPISALPPDLVSKVMNGGLIPGLNAEQTEQIKRRYMQMFFGGSGNVPATPPPPTPPSPPPPPSPSVPIDRMATIHSQQPVHDLPVNDTQSIVNTSHPSSNDKPVLTGTVAPSSDVTRFMDRLPPSSIDLFKIIKQTDNGSFSVDDLDTKADIDDDTSNHGQDRTTLFTCIGLCAVALLTVILITYYCWRYRKDKLASKVNGNIGQLERRATIVGKGLANTTLYLGSPGPLSKSYPPGAPHKIQKSNNDDSSFDTFNDNDCGSCSKDDVDVKKMKNHNHYLTKSDVVTVDQNDNNYDDVASSSSSSSGRRKGSFITKTLSYFQSSSFSLKGKEANDGFKRRRLRCDADCGDNDDGHFEKGVEPKNSTTIAMDTDCLKNFRPVGHVTLASIHGEKMSVDSNKKAKLVALNSVLETLTNQSPLYRSSPVKNETCCPSEDDVNFVDETSTTLKNVKNKS